MWFCWIVLLGLHYNWPLGSKVLKDLLDDKVSVVVQSEQSLGQMGVAESTSSPQVFLKSWAWSSTRQCFHDYQHNIDKNTTNSRFRHPLWGWLSLFKTRQCRLCDLFPVSFQEFAISWQQHSRSLSPLSHITLTLLDSNNNNNNKRISWVGITNGNGWVGQSSYNHQKAKFLWLCNFWWAFTFCLMSDFHHYRGELIIMVFFYQMWYNVQAGHLVSEPGPTVALASTLAPTSAVNQVEHIPVLLIIIIINYQ